MPCQIGAGNRTARSPNDYRILGIYTERRFPDNFVLEAIVHMYVNESWQADHMGEWRQLARAYSPDLCHHFPLEIPKTIPFDTKIGHATDVSPILRAPPG